FPLFCVLSFLSQLFFLPRCAGGFFRGAVAFFPAVSPVADRARPMAETQKMWSRRDNRSNKRTDLAYSIAWSKHGLRPVKSRNWPLKNSSTEAWSISASEMRYTVGL